MILGVTLARGGSKGVIKKNIALCAGKPLLVWTIEAAQNSKLIDRYVVSTEDHAVRQVAERHGAEVLIRPDELSYDYVNRFQVIEHIAKTETEPGDIIVMLQCTSPIRKPGMIDSCIREFIQMDYGTFATGYECKIMGPWNIVHHYGKHRQETMPYFYDDGNVTIWRADLVREGIEYGTRLGMKVLKKIENIDINDEFDLWLAGTVLESNWVEK